MLTAHAHTPNGIRMSCLQKRSPSRDKSGKQTSQTSGVALLLRVRGRALVDRYMQVAVDNETT